MDAISSNGGTIIEASLLVVVDDDNDLDNVVFFFGLCTSLRVVVGQRFFIPVVGQLVFVENGRDDDRINNYTFI